MLTEFGGFCYDDQTRELRCASQPVHLSPKALDLLALLLKHRPRAVSKGELHAGLWPGTFVTDGNLAVLIAEIRRALADSARTPMFIRTVSRYGYAFVAAAGEPASARASVGSLLLPGGECLRLKPGENFIGRDPGADIFIDAVGVSRRHAAIATHQDGHAILRDLASKNGTFVDGTRISEPTVLVDHSELRLGSLRVVFRQAAPGRSTQTVRVPGEGEGQP